MLKISKFISIQCHIQLPYTVQTVAEQLAQLCSNSWSHAAQMVSGSSLAYNITYIYITPQYVPTVTKSENKHSCSFKMVLILIFYKHKQK